jgi:hypothetical protein
MERGYAKQKRQGFCFSFGRLETEKQAAKKAACGD